MRMAFSTTSVIPSRLTRFKSRKYYAFLDESCYMFPNPQGNICYSCVAVPEESYPLLCNGMEPAFYEYKRLCSSELGNEPVEWKNTTLNKLAPEFQAEVRHLLNALLIEHGGFVSAFFATVNGLIME